MASFPHPGSVTVCEINRDLITAQSLSDDRAQETYGKILGMVFSPVPFDFGPSSLQENEGQENGSFERQGLVATLQMKVADSLKQILRPIDVTLLSEIDFQGVSWHQGKHIIAFISGASQVTILDYEDNDEKEPCILTSDSQRSVKAIEWRPNGGKSLSVACRGGICIWAASYPGNMALVRSGGSSLRGSLSRGSGTRWILVDFLRCQNDEQISALSWSPCGRYLASASYDSSSFTIWDVSQGAGTPIRRGLGGISMLRWSPTGDYFFAARFDGTFCLWETNTWTSEPWSLSAGSGSVTGAIWDPEGRLILISFSKSSTLGSVHFSSKPPSLDAHLLPVTLPDIASLTGSEGIEKIAWDASGERLAVSYKGGDENYKGLIAIYDTRITPIVSASLVGFIRGPGENPKALSFSFHDKFKQGPLLSVRFYCGGRLVFGPDASSLLLTASMIGGPAITFCIRMVYLIGHRYPAFHSLLLMGAIMITILDFVFLFLTSSRDPGIIPRNKQAPEAETPQAISQSLEWVSNKVGKAKLPRTKDITTVNGFTIKVKFCHTCQLYRPPRASHCSICNNCVQRFDHHCPWVGQCIALRNYPFFVCFLSCSTLLCIYVFVFSCVCMLEVHGQFYLVLADDLILGVLVLYCFVSVWFVGGLTVFHFYLICTNQTTCENFRYHYDKNENPFRKGILQNFKELFFAKIPPSLINFRDWAREEEDDVEVGSIASERGRAYSPRDTEMSSGKPADNNIDLRLQNQQYGNNSDAAVQEISVDEGPAAIGSVDQEPANLRRNSSVDVRSR